MSNKIALEKRQPRYSLEQANSMLGLIRDVIGQLQDAAAVSDAESDQLAFFEKRKASVGRAEFDDEFEDVRSDLLSTRNVHRQCLEELQSLSVSIDPEDFTHVDIAGSLDGKPIVWCWRTDEPNITHWHLIGQGLADRRSI
ncbi:MAG: DUF2203 family protein [Planctomycetota bacterium]